MINQLLLQGLVLFGSVDQLDTKIATIEYLLHGEINYAVISVQNSPCELEEGMEILFTPNLILKCFCKDD